MSTLRASFDLNGALDVFRDANALPRKIVTAQKRALGTVSRRLFTETKRDIAREYRLTQARIAQGLTLKPVQQDDSGISLIGSARGVQAIAFGATWTRTQRKGTGARWAVRRDAAKTVDPGTFIITGKSGNRLVVSRGGKGAVKGPRGGYPRLPLVSYYGPSVGQMLKHAGRPERLADFALGVLKTEQERLLKDAA